MAKKSKNADQVLAGSNCKTIATLIKQAKKEKKLVSWSTAYKVAGRESAEEFPGNFQSTQIPELVKRFVSVEEGADALLVNWKGEYKCKPDIRARHLSYLSQKMGEEFVQEHFSKDETVKEETVEDLQSQKAKLLAQLREIHAQELAAITG